MKHCAIYLVILIFFSAGCSTNRPSAIKDGGTIRIKGSDSMLLLVQRLAERYMSEHPDKIIAVEGGGSGVGVQSLIKGTSDICAASRPLTPEEVRLIAQKYQSLGVSILCAKDVLSIVVHPSNPVKDLTEQTIKGIFTGTIGDWGELGGRPRDRSPSIAVNRIPAPICILRITFCLEKNILVHPFLYRERKR
jgi:phosphate transport system substrate-binding protein